MDIDENKYSRAIQLMDISRYSEARKLLLEILADHPEDSSLLSFIAVTYLVEDKSQDAIAFALKAVQAEPDNGRNHHILSLAYLKLENFELAFDHNTTSLNLEPENTEYLVASV
jgi:predicted Zn-dependent protease